MSIETIVYCEECGRKFDESETICKGCLSTAQDEIAELKETIARLKDTIERLERE